LTAFLSAWVCLAICAGLAVFFAFTGIRTGESP
jgi:hypothetical protein